MIFVLLYLNGAFIHPASMEVFMKILMSLTLVISGAFANASELPRNIEFIMACYSQCERGIVKKVNGKWIIENEAVKTFTIRMSKVSQNFKMYASGSEVINPGSVINAAITVEYQGKVANDGTFSDRISGLLQFTGELDFRDPSTKCTFSKRVDLGINVLDVSCKIGNELDFSGLVVVTEKIAVD